MRTILGITSIIHHLFHLNVCIYLDNTCLRLCYRVHCTRSYLNKCACNDLGLWIEKHRKALFRDFKLKPLFNVIRMCQVRIPNGVPFSYVSKKNSKFVWRTRMSTHKPNENTSPISKNNIFLPLEIHAKWKKKKKQTETCADNGIIYN